MSRQHHEQADQPEKSDSVKTPLPAITHLQFLALDIVGSRTVGISAPELRNALLLAGEEQQGPKFYQLMKRLEGAELVSSWHQEFELAGGRAERTYYKITPQGRVAHRITLQFYEVRLKLRKQLS